MIMLYTKQKFFIDVKIKNSYKSKITVVARQFLKYEVVNAEKQY